jgi:hypothetical protein
MKQCCSGLYALTLQAVCCHPRECQATASTLNRTVPKPQVVMLTARHNTRYFGFGDPATPYTEYSGFFTFILRSCDCASWQILIIKPAFEQDQDGTLVPSWSCSQAVYKPVWHIPLLCVQWKFLMMDRGTVRNMKSFISKNKFEKLVHLFGFIIRICHDARTPERQINECITKFLCVLTFIF